LRPGTIDQRMIPFLSFLLLYLEIRDQSYFLQLVNLIYLKSSVYFLTKKYYFNRGIRQSVTSA
jgi:hypothetical protein